MKIVKRTLSLIAIFIVISFLYIISTPIFGIGFIQIMERHFNSKNRDAIESSLMAADGLITTSTFAFVAFSTISANGSGSTIFLNRVGWKHGYFWFRYPWLLVGTTIITLIDAILIVVVPYVVPILCGVLISSIILIIIIGKYTYFFSNLNMRASEKLIKIFKEVEENFVTKEFRKYTRIFLNPLRGSGNLDLFREIFTSDYILEIFIDQYLLTLKKGGSAASVLVKPKDKENVLENHPSFSKHRLAIFDKFLTLISSNFKLESDEKIELCSKIWNKMQKEEKVKHKDNKVAFKLLSINFDFISWEKFKDNEDNHFKKFKKSLQIDQSIEKNMYVFKNTTINNQSKNI